MTYLDPRRNQCELEVQRIIHLQNLANQLPMHSLIQRKQLTNESKIRLKCGRPVDSKDVTPRKRRTQEKLGTLEEAIKMTDQFKIDKSIALEEAQIMQKAPKEAHIEQEAPEEAHINEKNDEDPKPRNVEECRHRNDWPKWKEAIQAELNSLTKREVFGPVVQTPKMQNLLAIGRMWYNCFSEYLLKEGYVNNPICPCIFIKKSEIGFAIIAVYVDDLNLVETPEELTRTTNYLKKEFEMKDLRKTKFFLVHQSTYIKKVLKCFYIDKAHHLCSPMVVRSLYMKNDSFRHCEKDEELLGHEVPYLSVIGALMYLANCTRPDIVFSVNLLARYKSAPIQRHWNDIKHILRYLSDPHKGRSQSRGYIKGDRTKHVSPKFFYTHELRKSGEIVDLFTKSLPTSTFKKLIQDWNRQLKDIDMRGVCL
ncbi:hypothetical protein AAG906_007652 [Vitis piasezkii]